MEFLRAWYFRQFFLTGLWFTTKQRWAEYKHWTTKTGRNEVFPPAKNFSSEKQLNINQWTLNLWQEASLLLNCWIIFPSWMRRGIVIISAKIPFESIIHLKVIHWRFVISTCVLNEIQAVWIIQSRGREVSH